jgi:hypothetical protein
MLLEVRGYSSFLVSGSFGGFKTVSFSLELAILTKTSQTLQINLYNLYAPSRPGFPSFIIKYYTKILLWMSRQFIEIVNLLAHTHPEI